MDRGCHVVSATDPTAANFGFLDRSVCINMKFIVSASLSVRQTVINWLSDDAVRAEIAQWVQGLSYGLDDRGIGVRFPAGESLVHDVQTRFGVRPTSHKPGTVGSFPRE
jgi:hypothetical protein